MPSKRRFNSRFPPARIKKIMQTDEDIGKVAAPVPVLLSRALELFLEQILTKTSEVVVARNAKTLSKSHIKHVVMNENHFDFLKDLVSEIEDIPEPEEEESTRNGRKRRRKKSSESEDETPERGESNGKSSHGRRDFMLPVIVNVDDEQNKELDCANNDSVATLPVPIATPMASPNTLASVITESMQNVGQVCENEDDDYDS